jgi:hypothetical protein
MRTKFWFESLKGKQNLEDQHVDARIILGSCPLESSGSRQGPVAGCCEYGNGPSGFIKGG